MLEEQCSTAQKLSPDEAQSAIRVLNGRDAVTSFLKNLMVLALSMPKETTAGLPLTGFAAFHFFMVNITGNFSSATTQGGCASMCMITKWTPLHVKSFWRVDMSRG